MNKEKCNNCKSTKSSQFWDYENGTCLCDKCHSSIGDEWEANNKFNPKIQVKEYKRKCNQCGKVWHSLAEREKQIAGDMSTASLNQVSNACTCNSGAALQAQRNVGASRDSLDKLKCCPQCGSQDYKESVLIYDKK